MFCRTFTLHDFVSDCKRKIQIIIKISLILETVSFCVIYRYFHAEAVARAEQDLRVNDYCSATTPFCPARNLMAIIAFFPRLQPQWKNGQRSKRSERRNEAKPSVGLLTQLRFE
jgi:hypothetical protein